MMKPSSARPCAMTDSSRVIVAQIVTENDRVFPVGLSPRQTSSFFCVFTAVIASPVLVRFIHLGALRSGSTVSLGRTVARVVDAEARRRVRGRASLHSVHDGPS